MSQTTRQQEYRYQYKTVSIANDVYFCGAGPRMFFSIPDKLLDIKAINMHAVVQFNAATPVEKRKIIYAGGAFMIGGDRKLTLPNAGILRVDAVADANRVAVINLDITHLAKQLMMDTDMVYWQKAITFGLIMNDDLNVDNVTGVIKLWKIDFVYTTSATM